MRTNKIIYWVATGIFAAFMLFSSYLYASHAPALVAGFATLGYPGYMMYILATAKFIGAVILVIPFYDRLKEWAYAGFTINLVGAEWSHMAAGVPSAMPLVFLILLAVSYVFYRRVYRDGDNFSKTKNA